MVVWIWLISTPSTTLLKWIGKSGPNHLLFGMFFLNLFFHDSGIRFLLMCNYDLSKLPVKLSQLSSPGSLSLSFINRTFHHRDVLFGTIRTLYSRTSLYLIIIGSVMVYFWWSSCLISKVFCSDTQNFFPNTKYQ